MARIQVCPREKGERIELNGAGPALQFRSSDRLSVELPSSSILFLY
jgi:hypothetical protein